MTVAALIGIIIALIGWGLMPFPALPGAWRFVPMIVYTVGCVIVVVCCVLRALEK